MLGSRYSVTTSPPRRASGFSGFGAASGGDSVAAGATISPDFAALAPGTYDVHVTGKDVHLGTPTRTYYDVGAWNDLLVQRGILNARVTSVRYAGQSAASSVNPAEDLLEQIVGSDTDYAKTSSANAVADFYFVVTVEITGPSNGGMGVAPMAIVGGALAILAVVAIGFALIDAFAGTHMLVTLVDTITSAVGGGVQKLTTPLAMGLVPVVLIAAAAFYVMNKAGVKGKVGGFSIGG